VGPITQPTPSPIAGIRRLETSRESRRTANIAALSLVFCAIVLPAWVAWALFRLSRVYPEGITWWLYFSLSFSVLSELWFAHWLYLLAHTVLEFSSVSLRLTRSLPAREWSGPWRAVRHAYFYRGILVIKTTERIWHGWAIKPAPSDAPLVDEFKRHLGPGVWLDDRQARLRFIGSVFLVHAIVLVVTLVALQLLRH
jgi:hypothetical protein